MSKVFDCWFWKKKKKNLQIKNQYLPKESIFYAESGPEIRDIYKQHNKMKKQNYKSGYRKTSEPLPQDQVYLQPVFGLNPDRKVRSYPASPVRKSRDDKGYMSDQKHYTAEKTGIPYEKNSPVVYTAKVANRFVNEKSNEPFPYEIPKNCDRRRSSLFYGVKYEDLSDLEDSSRFTAEKPIETYSVPSTSGMNNYIPIIMQEKQDARPESKRRVTIQSSETREKYIDENEINDIQNDPVRKTVVRFRPHSSGSCAPSQSVKLMTFRVDEVQHQPAPLGRHVHEIPFKPSKQGPVLMTADGKQLQPVNTDKIRRMSTRTEHETQPVRKSVIEPNVDNENESSFPLNRNSTSIVYAAPTFQSKNSFRRPSVGKSMMRRETADGKRYSFSKEHDVEKTNILEENPFGQRENEPVVYAVPVIPTRGRTKSILERSIKSLSSKDPHKEPTVHKKNIRYSMDTDVFSANRRKSTGPSSPGYVNMEKGNTMLVSEFLSPITSLFVSDLKDPVPKDPLTKPKESNVWVKPRRYSVQKPTVKHPPIRQVHVTYKDPAHKVPVVSARQNRSRSRQSYRDDYSSSSDESIEDYRKKSKRTAKKQQRYYHAVYAAQMPEVILPTQKGKNPPFKKTGKYIQNQDTEYTGNNDFCGLNCETPEEMDFPLLQASSNVKMVSSTQQTDIEDEMDLLCYPSEKILKNTTLADESNSKLRWRIIIKRGEEK